MKYTIQSHLDVVKDVQFHPLENILVSGGDDGKLIVNRLDNNKVVEIQDIQYNMTIWRVSFNMLGNLLTVNGESNG